MRMLVTMTMTTMRMVHDLRTTAKRVFLSLSRTLSLSLALY